LFSRNDSIITGRDAGRILDELLAGFKASNLRKKQKAFRFASEEFFQRTESIFGQDVKYVACGFYAAKLKGLAATDEITIYVTNIAEFRDQCSKSLVPMEPDEEYGNIRVIENDDPGVWFNISGRPPQVDDIELYLEMMNDKPRGPKIAEQLKEKILEDFRK